MKLVMIFALLIVASAAAKKSDDPCVPCEILKIAIEVCPDCEVKILNEMLECIK